MQSTVTATADSKMAATSQVQSVLAAILAEVRRMGGQVLTERSSRAALTWSAQSIQTQPEYGQHKITGEHGPTGRQQSSVTLQINVRDFALLEDISAELTSRDSVQLHSVSWSVDEDNSHWALVRSDAIQAALLKGQDYAAALGGTIISVDHVADAGLLGGDGGGWAASRRRVALSAMGAGLDDMTLDPVPQVLSATIEARFTAEVRALPTH